MGDRPRRQGSDPRRARASRARTRRRWVHSDDKVGRDVGEICGIGPIGVTGDEQPRRDLRARRRRGGVLAGAREHARRDPAARVGQERRDAGRLDLSRRLARCRRAAGGVHRGWRHAARHRHQSRRYHRTLPAHAVGAVPQHPSRARRRVLRHPQLPDRDGRARSHAVRQDPETAAKSPMVDMLGHGFMQSIDMVAAELGLDARRGEASTHEMAVATRTSTRRSASSRRAPSPRSASRGRAPSTASR